MDRQTIAYLLIALMAAAVVAVVAFNLYHSRDRTNQRARKRETDYLERREKPGD